MDQSERVIELFGGVAPDARFHDASNILKQVTDLSLGDVFQALDFGCGNGLFTLDLARTFPRSSVLGLDLTPAQIDRARANALASGLGNVAFELGDLSSPALGATSFDLVLALQVVQFLEDPIQALSSWRSSLTPGGWLLLTTVFVPEGEPGRPLPAVRAAHAVLG